jgi:uncharacterized repeat protein (TIGR03803 family)
MNAGVVFKVDTKGHAAVLHSFTGGADGSSPNGVIRDSAGNLYGTTRYGGPGAVPNTGLGVIFKIDTTGQETVLYSFTCPCGPNQGTGSNPMSGVIRDSAGNLYGAASVGGAANGGVVYRLDTAGNYKVLHNFSFPPSGVIADSSGNLYGTTLAGGKADAGVVFKLDVSSRHGETVLYSFSGGADGGQPYAGVARDSAGNLYGTTYSGGTSSYGVVYKLDTAGQETVLHSFSGGADGGYPNAGVVLDSAGNLYGTTSGGGMANGLAGAGVVYELDTAGQETVLYSFTGGADGSTPQAGVIRDSAGNLYGTTFQGGARDLGLMYKVNAAGGQETVLYSFPGAPDGDNPQGGVILDSAGNLYGTTQQGGPANAGVVYKLGATGETVLYSFTGGADGSGPRGGVIRDSAGNLYGTAYAGGASGLGVVFKVDTSGHETVLYSFTGGADGCLPQAGVIRDSAGNLYGTASPVVYKLDTAGNYTVLYRFTGGADGANPNTGVIRDSAGNLYGTTYNGGTPGCNDYGVGCGVVYKVDTAGHETVLYSFTGGADGANPNAGVIRDSAGNLYGTTYLGGLTSCDVSGCGVVYKVDSAGQETVLHSFAGGPADGAGPLAGVVRDTSGNLYGTTALGTVYELDTANNLTGLYTFGGSEYANPYSGLIRDSRGNLYGTTCSGGAESSGTVFKLIPQ